MSRPLARSIAVIAVVCAVSLAACGGSSAPPAPGAGSIASAGPAGGVSVGSGSPAGGSAGAGTAGILDQCSLLTASEVEAATGRRVVSSGPDPAGLSKCLWVLEPATENRTVGVTAYLDDPRAKENYAFETRDSTAIPGLSEAAAYEIRTGGDYVLNVLRGDDSFRLQASYGARPEETNFSRFEALARRILDRL